MLFRDDVVCTGVQVVKDGFKEEYDEYSLNDSTGHFVLSSSEKIFGLKALPESHPRRVFISLSEYSRYSPSAPHFSSTSPHSIWWCSLRPRSPNSIVKYQKRTLRSAIGWWKPKAFDSQNFLSSSSDTGMALFGLLPLPDDFDTAIFALRTSWTRENLAFHQRPFLLTRNDRWRCPLVSNLSTLCQEKARLRFPEKESWLSLSCDILHNFLFKGMGTFCYFSMNYYLVSIDPRWYMPVRDM